MASKEVVPKQPQNTIFNYLQSAKTVEKQTADQLIDTREGSTSLKLPKEK
jgi:hypothetical protein